MLRIFPHELPSRNKDWFTTALSKVVLKGTFSFCFYETFYVGSACSSSGDFRSNLMHFIDALNSLVSCKVFNPNAYALRHGHFRGLVKLLLLPSMKEGIRKSRSH